MNTRTFSSLVARLFVGAACVWSASCGGELLRTGRGAAYIVVESVTAGSQGGDLTAFLNSDVLTEGGVINDNVSISMHLEPKNASIPLTAVNSVTMTRYTVEYRRSDGQNVAGRDVPYGFSGALSGTVGISGSTSVAFEVVRHQAKREPPLANMAGAGGLRLLSTVAQITLYGRDQNGNEVMATAAIDVHFGDFADEE